MKFTCYEKRAIFDYSLDAFNTNYDNWSRPLDEEGGNL